MMTGTVTTICFIVCLLNICVTSTPTPPLPGSIVQTSAMDQTVLLNPTATLYALQASSVYMAINSGCGGNLTNHTGQLTHPTYPQSIERPCACTWRIKLDPGTRISMLFNYFNLKGDCGKDFLEVWETSSSGSQRTMLKRSCGDLDKPVRLVTKTNEIEVVFQSNSSISGGGFLVTYSTFSECNQTYTNNTALVQSPYYPDDYPLNVQCAYSIKVSADHQISLSLEFLDLTYSVNCTEDILEVWDGPIGSSAVIGRYCGYLFSQWLRSKGNELSLRFTSDMKNTRRGFRLRYYAIKSDCNSTVNLTKGFIATPSQHASTCSWTINSPPGHVISIRFDRFFLKLSEDCSRDYLVIKDDQSEIGRYCGYQKGELVYSNDNSVTLEYLSTTVDDSHGFQIYYETLIRPESHGYLNKTRGYLQSPVYPNNYPSNTKHAWQIEQLPGYVIELGFDDFDLEFSVNCTQDYLEIFDGADNSSVSLGKHCGSKKSSDRVTTSRNLMYLEFASNSRRTAKGFRVTYTGIKSDCPKNFTNASGTIVSPNYPDFYPMDYDCQWQISYEVGYQVYLTLTYFDLVFTPKCSGDYVFISGITGEKEDQPERLCGYLVKRNPLVSKENKMTIKFHSDDQDTSRGFVLNYKVDGTGYPAPPRSPESDELKQAVQIEFYNITKSQWITNKHKAFKKLIANATNVYCQGENLAKCRLLSNARQRRTTETPAFTVGYIHLAPGFPNTGDASALVVVFYALYSSGMKVDTTWKSPALPQEALLDAVRDSQDYIASSFGCTIKSISAYTVTTSPPATIDHLNLLAIILPIVSCFILLVGVILAACLYWRKKNHGMFLVKRCVTPIEFVDENDEIKLEKVQSSEPIVARRRASTLKVVDLDQD